MSTTARYILPTVLAGAVGLLVLPALGAGDHEGAHQDEELHGRHHEMSFGEPAAASEASRTIEVVMTDTAFDLSEIEVEAGETVRFEVRNEGELVHEFSIATEHMHMEHQDQMLDMMQSGALTATEVKMGSGDGGMSHDHANSLMLEPGKSGSLTWTFAKSQSLEFACNVPDHYQQGMMGPIHVHTGG